MNKRILSCISLILAAVILIFVLIHQTGAPGMKIESPNATTLPSNGATVDEALNTAIADYASASAADYGVYVVELKNATDTPLRKAAQNADAQFVPASVYKIFVAYSVLHRFETNELQPNLVTRTGQTTMECVEDMLINSDNDCGRALGFSVGWQTINDELRTLGLTNTNLNNYDPPSEEPVRDKLTTAQDVGLFLEKLYNNQLLNNSNTRLLIDIMKKQAWRERLAAGLPANATIASKPGWLTGIQTDAGIVYGPSNTYIAVILSTESTPQPLATLSELIYNHLNSEQR